MNKIKFHQKYPKIKKITKDDDGFITFWDTTDICFDPCRKEWLPINETIPHLILITEEIKKFLDYVFKNNNKITFTSCENCRTLLIGDL